MDNFYNSNEARRNFERISNFLKNAKNTECSWGTLRDGICLKMRAFNINYSVNSSTPNIIEYSYSDNFNNTLKGNIIL